MKGDFTRNTFDPKKHYSAVLQQQGRVQLDADWNEQQSITRHRIETETRDVIGPCGAPADLPGFVIFGIRVQDSGFSQDFVIQSGRIYVDGLLCELESEKIDVLHVDGTTLVLSSDSVDGRPLKNGDWIVLEPGFITGGETVPIYARVTSVHGKVLNVLHVNLLDGTQSLDQASIITAQRRISYLTQPFLTNAPFSVQEGKERRLDLPEGIYLVYIDAWEREVTALDDPAIQEIALGGIDTCIRSQVVWHVKLLKVPASTTGKYPECTTSFREWDELTAGTTGKMSVRVNPLRQDDSFCSPVFSRGYKGIENQLYRIEIHKSGDLSAARFKWSRDNACSSIPIVSIEGNKLTVSEFGKDERTALRVGQHIEIICSEWILNQGAGVLARIESLETGSTKKVLVNVSIDNYSMSCRDFRIVVWDYSDSMEHSEGIPLSTEFIMIENGMEVAFSKGIYRSGDYWLVPARTAKSGVEWQGNYTGNTNTSPVFLAPHGVRHHYCRLAILFADEPVKGIEHIESCASIFSDLSALSRSVHQLEQSVHELASKRNATHGELDLVFAAGAENANSSAIRYGLLGPIQVVLGHVDRNSIIMGGVVQPLTSLVARVSLVGDFRIYASRRSDDLRNALTVKVHWWVQSIGQ